MPTPRFRDLSPRAAASVVDSFLGRTSTVELTEKLAGQHLTATSSDGRTWTYSVKSGTSRPGGFFPGIERALSEFHPDTSRTVTYRFEVLKKKNRPDFIAYDLKRDAAVEYSGALSRSTASILNDSQDDVTFLTKDDIKKTVGGLESPALERLEAFVLAARQGSVTKREMIEIEELLMGLIDSGVVSSAVGGTRIEGLFGRAGKMSFKIPSAAYADLQRRQAKFYALVRAGKVREVVKRFEEAAGDPSSDKAVSDVLDYIDYISSGGPSPGFKVFFSTSEASVLKRLADDYRAGDIHAGQQLARKFFQRVADKGSWVQSSLHEETQTTAEIIGINKMHVTRAEYLKNLVREYVLLLRDTSKAR